MSLVEQVGLTKSKVNSRIYVPERESIILKNLSEISKLSPKEIQSFYTEIISFCRKSEDIISVGILNSCESFFGLKQIFGEFVNPLISNDLNSLFSEKKNINYMLLPFCEKMIEFLLDSKWYIINTTIVCGNKYYLLSKFQNEIQRDSDIFYILTKNKFSEYSTELKNGFFFSSTTLKNIKKQTDSTIKILGYVPNL